MNALLFPGQGSQLVGMGSEFYKNFKVVKDIFSQADDKLNFPLSKIILELFLSIFLTGISSTLPVSGQIGKKGEYVFCLSLPKVGKIISMIPSKFSNIISKVLLKKPLL